MVIPIRFFFLLITIFTINSLWALVVQAVFPWVFKRVRPCNLEKIYFWFLMLPPIFLLSCLVICGLAENHWQQFFAGNNVSTYCTEFLHCDLGLNKINYEYLIYCIIGLSLAGLFIANLLKCFFNNNNYQSIPLSSLPEDKASQLTNIIQKVEEKICACLPPLEVITSHVNLAFVKGMLYHRILISLNLISELSPDELENLLMHEWEHCRKRDNLKNFTLMMTQSLNFWPNLRKKLLQTYTCLREIACDEATMLVSRQPLEIAHSIIKVSKLAVKGTPQVEGFASAFVSPVDADWQISARVHNLIHHVDASQREVYYFEKLSRKYKLIRMLEWGGLIAIMVVAFNTSCLEDYLIKVHCLMDKVIHLLIV